MGAGVIAEESRHAARAAVTAVITPAARCKLPAIPEAWNAQVSDPAKGAAKGGAAEILVIDDDAIMRDLVTDWL